MSHKHSEPPTSTCCSTAAASTELKLYKAFIFSVPIFFTFVLLFLFYLFYLRRRRVDWSSLRMRTTLQDNNNDISRAELGLKKEVREMLPIIIYKESFFIKDTQCSVCLGDYQAEDKLQQIPSCGHAFHMDCIDPWLAIHSTCPLCRLSLLASAKPPPETPNENETAHEPSVAGSWAASATPLQPMPDQNSEETQEPDSRSDESGDGQRDTEEENECGEAENETEKHSCGFSGHA